MQLDIPIPSLDDLYDEFTFIRSSFQDNVPGVWVVDSGKPGPVLGVTMQTHGNEPSGLAALWYFRNHFEIAKHLKRGKVVFVLNNLKGAEAYFAACRITDAKKREQAKKLTRVCDHNFNRLPRDTLKLRNDHRYEVRRAQELRPVWATFDVGLDIHSTSQESEPMIVACVGFKQELIAGFPINVVISNIDKIQIEKPAISFYGKSRDITVIGIEAGSHENPASFVCAVKCVQALMQNLGLVAKSKEGAHVPQEYREYRVYGSVILPTKAFRMVKPFKMFEPIEKGDILARGNGTEIVALHDGHTLFGSAKLTPDHTNEEMVFLTRRVKTVRF